MYDNVFVYENFHTQIHSKGTDIGIKLLPVMWECLCIPRHIHCSCSMVMAQVHSVMHISIPTCLLFLQSLYVPFNFSFTCLRSFFIWIDYDPLLPTLNWKYKKLNFLTYIGEYNLLSYAYFYSLASTLFTCFQHSTHIHTTLFSCGHGWSVWPARD